MSRIVGCQANILKEIYENKLKELGYAFFDSNKPYNLNIIGIRSVNQFTNKFDDSMVVIYRDKTKQWVVDTYVITTDPGKTSLKKLLNKKGCAILVPGQYRSTYKLDLHAGKYLALCQRKGDVKVFRDDNKNNRYDMKDNTIEEGRFGINIHRSARSGESEYVNSWSAGCQVFKRSKDFYEFIDTCQMASDRFGNSFTYTLINEDDFYV